MSQDHGLHNNAVLRTLEVGDLAEFDRGVFSHWGVYIGDEAIVHLARVDVAGTAVDSSMSNVLTISETGYKKACVKKDNFWDVAGNSRVIKNNNKDRITLPYPKRDIKERALSRLGPASYSVFWDNCEHFASWCRYGTAVSDQADAVIARVGGLFIAASLTGFGGLVNAARTDRNYYWRPFLRRKIKKRALSRLGTASCSDLLDNCEQFGIAVSDQADAAMTWVGGFVLGASLTRVEGLVYATQTGRNDRRPYPRRDIKERALSRLGPASYSVVWDNCEHFASWFPYGIAVSDQADAVIAPVGGVLLAASLTRFGGLVNAARTDRNYTSRKIKKRVSSRLGKESCSDLLENCKQFGIAVSDQADASMTWVCGFVLGTSLTRVEGLFYVTQTDRNDRSCKSWESLMVRKSSVKEADAPMTVVDGYFPGASFTGFGRLVYATGTDRNNRSCKSWEWLMVSSVKEADAPMTVVNGFFPVASLTGFGRLVYPPRTDRNDGSLCDIIASLCGSECKERKHDPVYVVWSAPLLRPTSDSTMWDNLNCAAVTRYGTQSSGRYYLDRGCSTGIFGIMNLFK